MAYKYKYYRKAIPAQFREQLGITEFKLSLKDISLKHHNLINSLLEVEFDNVFNRVSEFNAIKLKEYMALIYHNALLNLYGLKSNLIDKYLGVKNIELKVYSLEEGVTYYLKHHTENKNTGLSTLNNHKIYANKLFDFFEDNKDLNTLTEDEAEEFKESITLGAGSWNNHLAYYNGMMNYLITKKKIKFNAFNILDKADVEDSSKVEFEISEIEEIVNTATDIDIKIVTMIQAYTGMRIGEVALLKKKNIIGFDTIKIDYLKDTKTKIHNRDIPIHPKFGVVT